jgi:uncharacterized protein (TIRG00374 family)
MPLFAIFAQSWGRWMTDALDKSSSNNRRIALAIAGCALGGVFLYLTFRDIPLNDLTHGIGEMKLVYLIPATVLVLMTQMVRALRFGIILGPFCRLRLKLLWDLMNIWAGANMVIPARLAELVRPYLLVRNGASFSSSLGAVMVERFFDLTGLLALLGVVLWRSPHLSSSYAMFGKILLAVLVCCYGVVILILTRRETALKIIDKVFSVLPQRISSLLSRVVAHLIEGMGIMTSFPRVLLILLYSIVLWVLFSSITFMFLLAFSIEAPFLVAVTIQVLMALGVALPTAPGFIGTFHAVGRYALALFSVNAVVAVSFATMYHLFSVLINVLLGLVSYATGSYKFDHSIFRIPAETHTAAPEG